MHARRAHFTFYISYESNTYDVLSVHMTNMRVRARSKTRETREYVRMLVCGSYARASESVSPTPHASAAAALLGRELTALTHGITRPLLPQQVAGVDADR